MIFNPTYNPADWTTDNSMKTEYDNHGLAPTFPGSSEHTAGRDFKPLLDDMKLTELSHKNFSDETMKQVCWVCKMYYEWHYYRHSHGLAPIYCDLKDKATITAESLKFVFCRFITEVKKLDGEDFPGKTLYHLIVCI